RGHARTALEPLRSHTRREAQLGRTAELRLTAALLLAAAVAWVVTANRMDGMDMGPGTDLGGLGWFAGIWGVMMAAMMLPSVAPNALPFARASPERRRRGR